MEQYKVLGRIGEGAHGYVMHGVNKSTGINVALKKLIIKSLENGVPKHIMREINSLRVLNSEYVSNFFIWNYYNAVQAGSWM